MEAEHQIDIARDFTRTPGGRYRREGKWSGEQFREDVLIPALERFERVIVDLDGPVGFTTSFLDEVFGGIIRLLGPAVSSRVVIRATARPHRRETAMRYVNRALNEAQAR